MANSKTISRIDMLRSTQEAACFDDKSTIPQLIKLLEGRKEVAKKLLNINPEKVFSDCSEVLNNYNHNIKKLLNIYS